MNIVIEGLDNSGKSTLAQHIARAIGRQVFSSEGPEKWEGELEQRVDRYSLYPQEYGDVIFDRHPCISDPLYSIARGRQSPLSAGCIKKFYETKPLFIYCDTGARGLGAHILKAHDTPAHMEMVKSHYASLLHHYRNWAMEHAHIIYRIGDDHHRIVRICQDFDPVRDVSDFMDKFGQSYEGLPRALPPDLSQFREDFLGEELGEYIKHGRHAQFLLQETPDDSEMTVQLAEQIDGLMDLIYVAIGTGLLQGFNPRIFREAWRRVHEANMKKEKVARRSDSTRHSLYDVRKPADWQKPDHTDLVEMHIHRKS